MRTDGVSPGFAEKAECLLFPVPFSWLGFAEKVAWPLFPRFEAGKGEISSVTGIRTGIRNSAEFRIELAPVVTPQFLGFSGKASDALSSPRDILHPE